MIIRILPAVVCLLCIGVALVRPPQAADAADAPASGLLRLVGGDFVPGSLASVESNSGSDVQSQHLPWSHPDFAGPLNFALSTVVSAAFPSPDKNEPAKGRFVIELPRGDRLFGDIVAVDDWKLIVATETFGEVTVLRSAVRRIARWDDGASVHFVGPGPITDWTALPDREVWQSGGNQLQTSVSKATAFRDIDLPVTLRLEAELSWQGVPNFVLAIGVDAKNSDASAASAYRVEVWDDEIVLLRELDQVADCVPLGKIADFDGQMRLTLELNQKDGQVVALSPQAEVLGEFRLPADNYPDVRPGVRLQNLRGNVTLESLSVMRIAGQRDRRSTTKQDSLLLEDSSVQSGRFSGIVDSMWVIEDGEEQRMIDPTHVVSLDFQPPAVVDKEQQTPPNAISSTAQLITHGGVRLSGEIRSITDGRLTLESDVVSEMIVLTHADIGRLTVANPKQLTAADSSFILGRLEFPGGKLTGRLVDTEGRSEPTPLRFAPRGSDPVNLATSFQGRIVYRDTPKQTPESAKDRRVREQREAALERANQRRGNQGGLWNAFTRAFGNNGADVVAAPAPRSMHLRSGEIIPCEVSSIDENGVVFASEVTKQTRLPQNQVRAIAFTVGCRDPEIEATRRDRLLTVPRIRKKNRPTHLIVAVNDDIMRCRLVEMNQKSLIVESRLEKIEISRDVVAQIIFLDDREVDEDEPQAADAVQQPVDLAVRAILRNGNRMSLFARSLKDSMLIGEHPLLGESKLKLGDVDQLLIGIDISEAGVDQPYGGWRLQDAPEPIIPEAGSAGSGSAISPLVGKEAPDFRLDLLDGGKFSVAEARGQVLVLDFWATWCGPCLQAMPMIEEAVSTFDDKQVRLIAVNLQEPVEPIRGVLKRLGISPEVALDIDGVAAARYQADAIPQTVVIDREGKIAHLFVGGGPNFGEQLRAAIAETVEKKP